MTATAGDVYELVVEQPKGIKVWFRTALTLLLGIVTMGGAGAAPTNPGGLQLSVVRKSDGSELFRSDETWGDDDGGLINSIEADLAAMSADEFESRWVDYAD